MSRANVAFRYDATPDIGLGHAVRVESLSNSLLEKGALVYHIVPAVTQELLEQRGVPASFIVVPGSEKWRSLRPHFTHFVLDTLWAGNAGSTADEVHKLKIEQSAPVTVIDSMPPDHFAGVHGLNDPDLLVTPSHDAHLFRPAPFQAAWQHGSAYALLATKYRQLRSRPKAQTRHHRFLLCTGGGDDDSLSLRIAHALVRVDAREKPPIDIVVGPMFGCDLRQALRHLETTCQQVTLHWQPASIADLINNATLVVGRPGLIRYEAACLGTPALFLSPSADYRDYFEQFTAAGLAEIYFQSDRSGEARFMSRLLDMHNSPPEFNRVASEKVDGLGAQRITEIMLGMRLNKSSGHYAH